MDLSALESISKILEKSLDFWGLILLLATALVVIGLVVEYWHDVQEFWVRRTWPMASFPWDKLTALAGGILVTIGVAGELLVTYKASRVETKLRENSHKIEALLTQKAGDAAASAKTAHDEANTVKLEADAIEKRLDAASTQLSVIERQVRVQGPRWKLLEVGKDEFIAKLKPFAGQKVFVMYCGRWGGVAPEPFRVTQDLLNFLTKRHQYGAGWNVSGGTWDLCPAGGGTSAGGNLIMTSLGSGKKVEDAAEALYEILNKLQISTIKLQTDPREANPNSLAVKFFGPGSPWQIAAKDPSVIVILVGDNPMFDLAGWNKRQKNHIK